MLQKSLNLNLKLSNNHIIIIFLLFKISNLLVKIKKINLVFRLFQLIVKDKKIYKFLFQNMLVKLTHYHCKIMSKIIAINLIIVILKKMKLHIFFLIFLHRYQLTHCKFEILSWANVQVQANLEMYILVNTNKLDLFVRLKRYLNQLLRNTKWNSSLQHN